MGHLYDDDYYKFQEEKQNPKNSRLVCLESIIYNLFHISSIPILIKPFHGSKLLDLINSEMPGMHVFALINYWKSILELLSVSHKSDNMLGRYLPVWIFIAGKFRPTLRYASGAPTDGFPKVQGGQC